MSKAKEIFKNFGEMLFYFTPVTGVAEISENLGREYSFYEKLVNSRVEIENTDLGDKLNYLLKENSRVINKLSAILAMRLISSFLFSYYFNIPQFFGIEFLACLFATYFSNRGKKSEEEEKFQLLEYFNR